MAGMRADSTTEDYRNALSGEGEFMSLGYEWSDKPHRLVYDLCGEIDRLRARAAELEKISELIGDNMDDCPDTPSFDAAAKAVSDYILKRED